MCVCVGGDVKRPNYSLIKITELLPMISRVWFAIPPIEGSNIFLIDCACSSVGCATLTATTFGLESLNVIKIMINGATNIRNWDLHPA